MPRQQVCFATTGIVWNSWRMQSYGASSRTCRERESCTASSVTVLFTAYDLARAGRTVLVIVQ